MLLAELLQRRSLFSAGSVTFTVNRSAPDPIAHEGMTVDWSDHETMRGSRVLSVAARSGGSGVEIDPASALVSWLAFDATTGVGVQFDGVANAIIGTPPAVPIAAPIPDYFGLLGHFPTLPLAGRSAPFNDATALLSNPQSRVLDGLTPVGGHECIIVELPLGDAGPDGTAAARLVGAFGPQLGMAQVELALHGGDGSVARWSVDEFVALGESSIFVPLRGTYARIDASGAVQKIATIELDLTAEGHPLFALGVPDSLDVDLPPGTTVHDANTGESWVLASAVTAPGAHVPSGPMGSEGRPSFRHAMNVASGFGWPPTSVLGGIVGAMLAVCGVGTLITLRAQSHRRAGASEAIS
ncbi:MAG TPA: hypothetical protein PKC43_12140 [Phycisphaerales bacterium]|nr:hypothetical protein [Phycisphaerales bacterium]HMP38182.1 hypothetical protein [Phycisphaerales bacterium]